VVEVPASNLKKDITRILYDKGYILSWKVEEDGKQGLIKIALKYNRKPARAPSGTHPCELPGPAQVRPRTDLPRVLNGLGVAIISTSKGVVTDKEART
jgi:small subunit ribosomal protein S8